MLHSRFLWLQANDLLISAQIKTTNPEVGQAIALLAAAIEKTKCRKCKGLGYLKDLTLCSKCAGTGTRRDSTTIRA